MDTIEHPLVTREVDDGVLVLTMNRQADGNALDLEMTAALAEAIESANAMSDVHCVLLRSSGRHFCTGGNVKDMEQGRDLMAGSVSDVRDRLKKGLHRLTRALTSLEVPSVCAVNGAAVGAGCDLALMCDIRLAGPRASFAESFLRLGLVSGIGGAWFLSRIVGPAKALELTLTSEFIDAEQAAHLGLVSKLVDDDHLGLEALRLARRIARNPPQAMRMAKQLVRESSESSLGAALEMAASMQAILLCGEEHRQTVLRFLEQQAEDKRRRTA